MSVNFTFVLYCGLLLQFLSTNTAKECIPRLYNNSTSIVCVCNATYCDTISPIQRSPPTNYLVYTSNRAGLRFQRDISNFTSQDHFESATIITLNVSKNYQRIIGWGGAFTDSVGMNINSLSPGAQENLLRSYFSEMGIEYNIGRVPMASTDFSTHFYSYDDGQQDVNLNNFHLAHEDYKYKIPLLKRARKLTNNTLLLFASAWTSPKWMKTNNKYNGLGYLKPCMYQPWAKYFLKFLKSYKRNGITFWGITTGNEPFSVERHLKLGSVAWIPSNQSYWIRNNLGPTLRSSEFSDIKIIILDDSRNFLLDVANSILSDNLTNNYTSGIGVHWYLDETTSPTLLDEIHNRHPDKFILNTEASFMGGVTLGSWLKAEMYVSDIIQDLNNWASGWVEWNIALNLQGGPTFIHNYLDASILVNSTGNEFYKQPTFYALGHFSKFIPRGSVRIGLLHSDNRLTSTAFKRPDNGIVLVILNVNDFEVPLTVLGAKEKHITRILSPNSITTIVYWPN